MRLLVTGAGTVGTAVARAARSSGAEVLMVDVRGAPPEFDAARCDVTDTAALLDVFRGWGPDRVVHTAGVIGRKVEAAPALAVGVNVTGTLAVLECARRSSVERVVLTSSLAVYDWSNGEPGRPPVAESEAGRPASLYGASKLAAETLARQFAEQGGPPVSALRLAGVYGPSGGGGGALLSATLNSVIRRLLAGEEVTLPALLGSVEYLAADDAARAILLALQGSAPAWRVLNVGAGRVHTSAETAAALQGVVRGARVHARPPVHHAAPLDLTGTRRAIGYSPAVRLDDGLAELAGALGREEAVCPTTSS